VDSKFKNNGNLDKDKTLEIPTMLLTPQG
jgi:hypothetical protein